MKLRKITSLLALSASLSTLSMGQITVYLSPNDIETAEDSGIAGVTTETFNSRPTGSVNGFAGAVGTYTGDGTVIANNLYGGNNEGNYLGIISGSTSTLSFASPVEYFGLYFTAGDGRNSFEIKSAGVTLLSFNTQRLIQLLPNTANGRITAIDGNEYRTRDYYGQPTSNLNASEPYSYIHIIGGAGTTFDQVVLSQASGGAIFESDNHSIRATAPAIPATFVNITQAVPEPTSAILGLFGAVSLLVRRRR